MVDASLIGGGTPNQHPICCYLNWDRYSAMADYIVSRHGLEVPQGFKVPVARELPAIKWSVCDWPQRIVIDG